MEAMRHPVMPAATRQLGAYMLLRVTINRKAAALWQLPASQ